MNAHHSEWLESVYPTDLHGCDAFDFCNLSGCKQLVRCPTHIVGNRLDPVMMDAPDITGVFIVTPMGIYHHLFVSCVLRVEQPVPENNVRSNVFLKHHTNWDNVCCAVRSITWSTILRSADPLNAFDRAISEVIGRFVSTTVLGSTFGDMQWLNGSCQRVNDAQQTAYCAWYRAHIADHWGRCVLACAEAQRVYDAARE